MENTEFLKQFIQNVNNDNLEKMDELIYYYHQGFEMGKDEASVLIASRLAKLNIDTKTISEATNLPFKSINQIIEK